MLFGVMSDLPLPFGAAISNLSRISFLIATLMNFNKNKQTENLWLQVTHFQIQRTSLVT